MTLLIEGLGQEETLLLREAATTVEVDGGIAVADLEVQEFYVVFERGAFGEIQKLRTNSLPTVGGLDEEFINPGAFAPIFEAVFKTDDEIADWGGVFPRYKSDAVDGILEEFGKIGA